MTLDIDQLTSDIKSTVSGIIGKDVETVRGFSKRQLVGMVNQTSLVAAGILTGEISDFNRDFFLDQLVELSHNFINTLIGLLLTTIETAWNAVVNVLWGAISKATGLQLPAFSPM